MANRFAVAGSGSKFKEPDAEPAGFWTGLWHGMILPIAFIVSLFKPEVGIYETHNNGGWYNLGFVLGVSSAMGKSIHVEKGGEPDGDEDGNEDEGA